MEKLFLLDAFALIYRSYYAFISNPITNSKGENTSAIFGFVRTLEEVLKKESPEYMAVAFDLGSDTFRKENYEDYKAQREASPEDITKSVPIIKEILKSYNIPIIGLKGFEADDVIGTLAKKASQEGIEVYMMTSDKDYVQLVDEHIFLYKVGSKSKGNEKWGIEEVKEKYGISSPKQMIDLLGLMGDSADNIPGCPGIGEKTAQKLLQEYTSIENLLLHKEEIKPSIQRKLVENEEQIRSSQFLATIRCDAPIDFNLESFRVKPCDIERRNRLFKALEFNSMIIPIKKREKKSEEPLLETSSLFSTSLSIEEEKREEESTPATPEKYRILHNPKEIEDFLHLYSASKRCSLWVEDSSSLERGYAMKSLSICLEEGEVGYISFSENAEDTKGELLLFKPILENEEILKIVPNTKLCINLLKHYGMMLRGKKFDPIIAHYLLDPDLPHNIEDISLSLLQHHVLYRKSTSPEKKEETSFTAEEDMEKNSNYFSERADLSFQLYEPLMEELEKSSLAELFYTIEMPLCEVLAEMEWNGVRIDKGNLNNLSSEMSVEMDRLAESICEIAGTNFNINSTKQVGEVLFEKLQLVEKPSKTKTHHYQTNEETLEKLRFKHPIVEKILQYRGIKKLLSTYILALPNLVSPISGHIHTTFNQTITSTGRLSSSNPNLQNIPVREEQGKIIRSAFIPEEGDLFFSADYSQIELRIMAHLSQDPGMLYAFNHGMDVHADTASKIHKVPIEEVTAEMRRRAKVANFGIIYGISPTGLSNRLGIPRKEAKELIENYFLSYPHIKDYMERCIQEAKEKGFVETLFHRRRFIPDINSKNATVRGYAERNAINTPVQGTAADVIKIAMVHIFRRFKELGLRSKMILQVHDELNFSVSQEEREVVRNVVVEEMEHCVELSIPLLVDCSFGKNWLEAH